MDSEVGTHKKLIMVTGGAGYAGSIVLRRLLRAGYKVVCVDCLRYGGSSLVGIWSEPDFTFEKVDITNYAEVNALFDRYKIYAVVHLAGIVGDPACKLEPDLARKTNLEASIHLLEKSIQSKVRRFIFASTCSNYGNMNGKERYVDENSPLAPVSLYAELKVAVEDFILTRITKNESFCPTILRFSTVYGVSPRMRFDLTVNEFTRDLVLGKEVQVYGEQFWRPYCHVNDYAQAVLSVLKAGQRKVAYQVFNVGDTSQNYSKRMLIDEIRKQVPGGNVIFIQKNEDPRNYRVNFDKIKQVLNFNSSKCVPEGIQEVLSCIKTGAISDPENSLYNNTPVQKNKV